MRATLERLEGRSSFTLLHGNKRLKIDPTAAELDLETVFSDWNQQQSRRQLTQGT